MMQTPIFVIERAIKELKTLHGKFVELDVELTIARADARGLRRGHKVKDKRIQELEAQAADCLERLEGMVPREKYRDVVAKRGLLLEDHRKLMEELTNARAEIGRLKAELMEWLGVVIDGCASEDGIDGSWGDKAIARMYKKQAMMVPRVELASAQHRQQARDLRMLEEEKMARVPEGVDEWDRYFEEERFIFVRQSVIDGYKQRIQELAEAKGLVGFLEADIGRQEKLLEEVRPKAELDSCIEEAESIAEELAEAKAEIAKLKEASDVWACR